MSSLFPKTTFYTLEKSKYILLDFVPFRFVSVRSVSFCDVAFRFDSVPTLIGTHNWGSVPFLVYRDPFWTFQ